MSCILSLAFESTVNSTIVSYRVWSGEILSHRWFSSSRLYMGQIPYLIPTKVGLRAMFGKWHAGTLHLMAVD